MLRPIAALCALALLSVSARAQSTISIDLGRGPVTVHIPSTYDPGEPMPLVTLLHGYGASGPLQESYMQFLPLTEVYGFLYMYPNGTIDAAGNRFWNATDACCNFFGSMVDDSGYLIDLVNEVKNQLNVDAERVHFIGHSNGGFMSYRMACDHADAIASIASLAGATFFEASDCAPSSPVHTLQIHGTQDGTILYNGGNLAGRPYPGAVGTAERWATYDACTLIVDATAPDLNLDSGIAGDETRVERYINLCAPAGSAELWTIEGGGHVPALSSDFRTLVIEYLFAHPRGQTPTTYCTAKSTLACGAPAISALGVPEAGATSGFLVYAGPARGARAGILLYSDAGRAALPFEGGLLCVAPTVRRSAPLSSGGTNGLCDGRFELDLNAFASGNAGGNPAAFLQMPGTLVSTQFWGRDTMPTGSFLSDGLELVVR